MKVTRFGVADRRPLKATDHLVIAESSCSQRNVRGEKGNFSGTFPGEWISHCCYESRGGMKNPKAVSMIPLEVRRKGEKSMAVVIAFLPMGSSTPPDPPFGP